MFLFINQCIFAHRMVIILNIETATKNCSVSLAENGKVIALQELNNGNYSHAEKLHVFIQDVLNTTNKSLKNIDAIAISKGPGSYTGLRIGVSSAKGLCYALDIPMIATNTLKTLALQVDKEDGIIVPMLDARRMEVYSAVFSSDNKTVREIEAQVLDKTSFSEYLDNQKVYFIGDGVPKTKEIITHKNAFFIDDKLPSANEIAQLSYDKFQQKNFEDVAYFEPFYLKDFVTTAKRK